MQSEEVVKVEDNIRNFVPSLEPPEVLPHLENKIGKSIPSYFKHFGYPERADIVGSLTADHGIQIICIR